MILPLISIFLLLVAIGFFIMVARQKKRIGIPSGKVIYADTSHWGKVEKPLFDPQIRLTGKPDYLVDQSGEIIPIEVKSSRSPQAPYDSHIYQLVAYCLLVMHEFGKRPGFGIIHYPDRTFSVEFTQSLENSVKSTIREMQGKVKSKQVDRSHDDPRRCVHCGYRSICDQSLRI
jgi:CRISPR-associated exonuclease Cas4